MEKITLTKIAKHLNLSTSFLCEIRKGKKRFSREKSLIISKKTGIPIETVLFAHGEELYAKLVFAYQVQQSSGWRRGQEAKK